MKTVVRVDWTEYERGWGQRPDGYSLHASVKDAKDYIKTYWDTMPDRSKGVPDEYSAPGEPYAVDVEDHITLGRFWK